MIDELLAFVEAKEPQITVRTEPSDYDMPEQPPAPRTTKVLEPADVPEPDLSPRYTLAEARALIKREIERYLNTPYPDEVLLVRAAPGVGKTHASVRAAEAQAAAGKRVLYAGPRHDFFADVMKVAEHPEYWYEWMPRQEGDDKREQTCLHTEKISSWMQKGYDGMDFCKSICGWSFVNDGCVWHRQKRRQDRIIYGQHQHIIAHPVKFDVVIGDENPTSAFMHEWRISARNVMPTGMPPTEDLTHMLHSLTAIVVQTGKNKSIEGPELIEALGGADRVLSACGDFRVSPDDVVLAPELHRPEDVDRASTFHLPALVSLLMREAEAFKAGVEYLHRVIVNDGHLILLLRRKASEALPQHIIWLDATGEPRIYEALFGRPVRVIDAYPRLIGQVYQVANRANGKGAITGDDPQAVRWREQLAEQIEAIKDSKHYKRPALITFQSIAGSLSDIESLHFYASRGTNRFETCDCMIIAGAPQPAMPEITKIARMIFFDRTIAFNETWASIAKPYNYADPETGKGFARDVGGYWSDPDLEAVLWSVREAELIQAAHRSRPISRNCDIWLLTNIPVDQLPPTRVMDFYDMLGIPQARGVVSPFVWRKVNKTMIDLWDATGQPVDKKDVARAAKLSLPTVNKVWNMMEVSDDYEVVLAGTGGRQSRRLIARRKR